MSVVVVTANLGDFELCGDPVEQSVPCDFFRFDDQNFPPRNRAMTPRFQARLPKVFTAEMIQEKYDFYIWCDSSLTISHPDTVKWFLEQCEGVDAAFFRHPDRRTIREEADFIKAKIAAGNAYLTVRYENELLDEEMAEIEGTPGFVDDLLIASSAFVYRPTDAVKEMMREWWMQISRFHIVDQLGLPFAIWKAGVPVRIIEEDYRATQYLSYPKHRGWSPERSSTFRTERGLL